MSRVKTEDSIGRAFKTLRALCRPQGVTKPELFDILGFRWSDGRRRGDVASKWIDGAESFGLPIIEDGVRYRDSERGGRRAVIYRIDEDFYK
jgi:hypothetical protein